MFPKIVNFMITGKCNNNCKYCYADYSGPDLKTNQLMEAFLILKHNGVSQIVLCGGEPTSRLDFKDIITFLIKHKFKIYLDSDGDFFTQYKSTITKYIYLLSLPIDFPNKSYRNNKNLENIKSILEYYKNLKIKQKPKIWISTVVTKDNYKYLSKIGDLIKNYKINTWKIYQFTTTGGNAKRNKKRLTITNRQFYNATRNLNFTFSPNFNVIISPIKARSGNYFLIKPNGTIFTPIKNNKTEDEIIIGNLFDKDILLKWDTHHTKKQN